MRPCAKAFSMKRTTLVCTLGAVLIGSGLTLFFAACEKQPASSESRQARTRTFTVKGKVRGVPPDHKTVILEHEDIPKFMPSMTMPFDVKDAASVETLKVGDAISFRLVVTDNDSWIEEIKKIDPREVNLPAPEPEVAVPSSDTAGRLHESDKAPEFKLMNQDGAAIGNDTFRGHSWVLTFVFTRCPIPTFCPRISQHFEKLQESIKRAQSDVKLVSITIDPEFDTPDILKQHAAAVHADPKIWTFATGEKSQIDALAHAFSVYIKPEGGTITHGLCTALIDENGVIKKMWRGNGWEPEEVVKELQIP